MTAREIRRLATLVLLLMAAPSVIEGPAAYLMWSRAPGGTGTNLIALWTPSAAFVAFVGLSFWKPDTVGRLFAPRSFAGAPLLGCALLRLYPMWLVVAVLSASVSGAGMAITKDQRAALLLGLTPVQAVLVGLPSILGTVALFVAAPWIARWVVGQVDSGVMWWTPVLHGVGRLGRWFRR